MSAPSIQLAPAPTFGLRPIHCLGTAVGFLLAAAAVAVGQPAVAVAAAGAFPVAAFFWSRPHLIAPLVVFLIYTNANAVAVKVHGLPFIVGAALPLLLLLPIWRDLRASGLVVLTRVVPMLIGYILVQFLGAVLSIRPDLAMSQVVTTLTEGLALYVLLINAVRDRPALERVTRALVAAGIVMASLTVYQWATGSIHADFYGSAQIDAGHKIELKGHQEMTIEELAAKSRPSGPMDAPNRFAQVLAVLLPLTLTLFAIRQSQRAMLFALGGAAIIGLATALTLSRGVTAGLALTFLGAAVLGYVRLRIVVACAVMMSCVFLAVPRYRERISTLVDVAHWATDDEATSGHGVDGSVQSRATEMRSAALMFSEHPIIGVGPGMYAQHYQAYARRVGGRIKLGQDRRSHSMYLDVAAEHGLAGFTLFFGMIGLTVRDLMKARERCLLNQDPGAAYLATGFLLALGVYLTTALTLHVAYARYFWILMALCAVASGIKPQPARRVERS